MALGLDFGTESVRALLATLDGRIVGSAEGRYPHGQIVPGSAAAEALFPSGLAAGFALQHPGDWLTAASGAVADALVVASIGSAADGGGAVRVVGIGVDATSCTVVPAHADGTPVALGGRVDADDPHAWPKLWKHHGAVRQAERFTAMARDRAEPWLDRYGGVVGLEWFFPKVLEVVECSPAVAAATEVWVEAGDWIVWQLTGSTVPTRSTCQAGYKGLWSRTEGFPSADYLAAVHPGLPTIAAERVPGPFAAPGEVAGTLTPTVAARFGLDPGIPVSTAIIDAHAGVPGAGVGHVGTLVLVLGTSGCHMVMAADEQHVPGVAGVVGDGILPGSFGYETGQAAVGDLFDWVRRLCGASDHEALVQRAADLEPGADGVLVVDWLNGCRTPLMDGRLTGAVLGLELHHGPEHLYRAALEASAAGIRWVVETLRAGGVPVDRIVATGGLPRRNPLFVTIVASMLDEPVAVHQVEHGPALGAAILGAVAAGRFASADEAVAAMSGAGSAVPAPIVVAPDPVAVRRYDALYRRYRAAASAVAALSDATARSDAPDLPHTTDRSDRSA